MMTQNAIHPPYAKEQIETNKTILPQTQNNNLQCLGKILFVIILSF